MAEVLHPDMQSQKHAGSKPGPSTTKYLDISEIRDDVVIMKDGTMRVVLLASSINFALKSEDEQEGVIQAYMQFLNSLEYPLQIVIQSRRMNIEPYLKRLADQRETQTNELLRTQIVDYISFITELVSLGDIMSKRFYVVIPYNPLSDKKKSFFDRVQEVFSAASFIKLSEKAFNERKGLLQQRVGHIQQSLGSMGVQGVQLDTQGLIELYYTVYNPETSENQRMQPLEQMRVER
ncbi:MAG: TraC family protein [bacterium]